MTNEELQEAITMANAMVKATGHAQPTYQALLDHLKALLKEQAARAEARPVFVTTPHAPMLVQPVIVQPTWAPQQPWEPPFRVTC